MEASFRCFRYILVLVALVFGSLPACGNAAEIVEVQSTTIGFGLGLRQPLSPPWEWGLLATNHSDDVQEQRRYRHVIRREAKLLLLYGRQSPLDDSPWYWQAGLAWREQSHDTLYRRDPKGGPCPCGGMGSIRLTWPRWALHLGLGWDWGSQQGLQGGLQLGWLVATPPTAELDRQQSFGVNTPEQTAYLEQEWRATPDRARQAQIWPLYGVSLGWRF